MARTLRSIALVVVLAALSVVAWRWTRAPHPPAGAASAEPARGGALTASTRSDPPSYNRYVSPLAAVDLVTLLTQAPLVRVNRASDALEPWLADRWTTSPDGRTYTLTLREAAFSDGVPFTSEDVLFSFAAVYDPAVASPLRDAVLVNGRPLDVSAPDAKTVVIRFPESFAPGLRVLDNLPILPKHRLAAALAAQTFADEWTPARPLDTVAGLGPFVLTEHVSGQRLVFRRNPHYFRRDAGGAPLPYLDSLTLRIVPDQNAEALRLQSGEIDLMANGELRPTDLAAFRGLESKGRVRLYDVGVSLDPDFLVFNLSPNAAATPALALVARKEFRQAISLAIDRQSLANTVYLGNAVPILGPVSPGNATWFAAPEAEPHQDLSKARALLASLGLADRDDDGIMETVEGKPARFSVLVQAGHLRAQVASALQAQLKAVGIAIDIVPMEGRAMFGKLLAGEFEAVYHGIQASSTDPALNGEFWLSSGSFHLWNLSGTPAAWEQKVDELLRVQATATDLARRREAFAEVQQILRDQAPAIYFVAPRVTIATTARVRNATPALRLPQLLWNADTLAVGEAR